MQPIYDPLEFLKKINIFTIAVIGSFITWKLLNCLYLNVYEPAIDTLIESNHAERYYAIMGKYYINLDVILKEFIKWIIVVVILMFMYNISMKKN